MAGSKFPHLFARRLLRQHVGEAALGRGRRRAAARETAGGARVALGRAADAADAGCRMSDAAQEHERRHRRPQQRAQQGPRNAEPAQDLEPEPRAALEQFGSPAQIRKPGRPEPDAALAAIARTGRGLRSARAGTTPLPVGGYRFR
ncbi:hypothetical protein WKI68_44500 [Streptomyces sp. MS1.HAVA.3]|uniref:Uncharacterized protein n=1 Tax=Streptomyces caledonius TaxID=3134107 RepID=A0ABU8UEV7_9ACTN